MLSTSVPHNLKTWVWCLIQRLSPAWQKNAPAFSAFPPSLVGRLASSLQGRIHGRAEANTKLMSITELLLSYSPTALHLRQSAANYLGQQRDAQAIFIATNKTISFGSNLPQILHSILPNAHLAVYSSCRSCLRGKRIHTTDHQPGTWVLAR